MRKEVLFSGKLGLCYGLTGSHCSVLREKRHHGDAGLAERQRERDPAKCGHQGKWGVGGRVYSWALQFWNISSSFCFSQKTTMQCPMIIFLP